MNERVLILGSTGMKGHVIYQTFQERGYQVFGLASHPHSKFVDYVIDVTNEYEFKKFLRNNKFDIIINAIGVLVEESKNDVILATYLNGLLPHIVLESIDSEKTLFVHLSTDCVFSGMNGPYRENDKPDGSRPYDITKRLGEKLDHQTLIVRSSVIGPELTTSTIGLLNWFLLSEGEINGYANVEWNGLTTFEFARELYRIIQEKKRGIIHLYASQTLSKYELLAKCNVILKRSKQLNESNAQLSTNKSLLSNINRPSNLDYETMLQEVKDKLNSDSIYSHLT